eukprot:4606964-Amphidinium_carterae.1
MKHTHIDARHSPLAVITSSACKVGLTLVLVPQQQVGTRRASAKPTPASLSSSSQPPRHGPSNGPEQQDQIWKRYPGESCKSKVSNNHDAK